MILIVTTISDLRIDDIVDISAERNLDNTFF